MTGAIVRPRGPGRPRDERADRAILDATLDLLAEVGPTGLSVEEVAARAGVSKATIYRRFPTKDDLVVGCLSGLGVALPDGMPEGGVHGQLVFLVERWWQAYTASPNGQVFHRVLAHAKSNPRLFEAFYDEVIEPRRELFRSVLRDAVASGEIRSDADLELIITMIIGTSVYTNQTRSAGRDPMPGSGAPELVDAALAGALAR
ncbi:MAG TPA: TetR/AcrR family transcriptional regulator [Candidatus Nanopelagicales bacterium]|nr:TetR/AcrR family transcriptional regulator [Candidatus Nanopelagicales bacterium]